MTDSENQRQRHLAEMMIAECDGKQVQRKNVHNDTWFPFNKLQGRSAMRMPSCTSSRNRGAQ